MINRFQPPQEAFDLAGRQRRLIEISGPLAEIYQLRDSMIALFVTGTDLKLSTRSIAFGWRTLVQHRVRVKAPKSSFGYWDQEPPPGCDHSYYFRCPDRRAAAIVTHPYHFKETELKEFADTHALAVEVSDWPSWWYPGRTSTIIWTRQCIDRAEARAA